MVTQRKSEQSEPRRLRDEAPAAREITTVEAITPDRAYEYLESAFKASNRRVSQHYVKAYAEAMRRGEWLVTNQGIGFDWNGVLRDGQHRLWAVVESGCTVRMNVTRNMDPAAFDVIDAGRRRTGSDILSIHGEVNTHRLNAALTWQWRQDNGQLATDTTLAVRNLSSAQRLETLAKHPLIRESLNVMGGFPGGLRRLLPPGLFVWLDYQLRQANPVKAAEFFEKLRSGAGMEPTDPVWLLRERLISNLSSKRRIEPTELAALCIKAWNLFCRGERRQTLAWKSQEAFPEIVRAQ